MWRRGGGSEVLRLPAFFISIFFSLLFSLFAIQSFCQCILLQLKVAPGGLHKSLSNFYFSFFLNTKSLTKQLECTLN